MLVKDLDKYFRELLQIDEFSRNDTALNGLQFGDENSEVKKAAFAVDACAETFRRAIREKADILFVHHGIYWGKIFALTGRHFKRIKMLGDSGLCLYAVHLPLDAHPVYGNNAGIADKLKLENREPFGEYKGKFIGVKGILPAAKSIEEIKKILNMDVNRPLGFLPFGKEENRTIGIVSGGATWESFQAIDEDLDLYITGDASHEIYHHCLEAGINVLFGGHYFTETYGVKAVCSRLKEDLGIDTVFIDLPTGF